MVSGRWLGWAHGHICCDVYHRYESIPLCGVDPNCRDDPVHVCLQTKQYIRRAWDDEEDCEREHPKSN